MSIIHRLFVGSFTPPHRWSIKVETWQQDPEPKLIESQPLSLHVRHSPDGHTWGYGGSGPSQAALDILWETLGYEPSPAMYLAFKDEVIATVPMREPFVIQEGQVLAWALAHPLSTSP